MKIAIRIILTAAFAILACTAHASPAPKPPSTSAPAMSDMSDGANMDMTPIAIPQLPEIGVYTATGHEDWKARTGFGHNDAMVGMMNEMMIEGSGTGKMNMGAMKMTFDDKTFADDSDTDIGPVVAPAPLIMPTPTHTLQSTPASPAPPAPVTAAPSTPSHPPAPSTATMTAPPVEPLKIAGIIAKSIVGENRLSLTVTDAQGSPVTAAKISASVSMMSMDMGTSHPLVKEVGAGKYTSTVEFTMAGPWRVTVTATLPNTGVSQAAAFVFNAK